MVVLKKLKKLTKNSHKTQVILLVFIFWKIILIVICYYIYINANTTLQTKVSVEYSKKFLLRLRLRLQKSQKSFSASSRYGYYWELCLNATKPFSNKTIGYFNFFIKSIIVCLLSSDRLLYKSKTFLSSLLYWSPI